MILYLLKYFLEICFLGVLPASVKRHIQLKKFIKIFEYAKTNSVFYKKIYEEAGVFDLRIKSFKDVKKIPVIDKEMMISSGYESVLTTRIYKDLIIRATSGSTGKPFETYLTRQEYFTSYIRTFLALKNFNPFRKFVLIGVSQQKEEIEQKSFLGFLKKYLSLFRRETIFIDESPSQIVQKLDRKILVLSTTPSVMKILCSELSKQGRVLNIKYLVLFGETLFDDDKECFRHYFNSKIINVYGCMELPSLSWTKPDGKYFHYLPNTALIEYCNLSKDEGKLSGQIVLTNFVNKTMPFIRYNLKDMVNLDDRVLNSADKIGPVTGRIQDIIEISDEIKIHRLQLWSIFKDLTECDQYRLLQKKNGDLVFQIKLTQLHKTDSSDVKNKIQSRWKKSFHDVPLIIEIVEKIELNPGTGKYKNIEVEK
jgi:phenylacetate-CoA ligase